MEYDLLTDKTEILGAHWSLPLTMKASVKRNGYHDDDGARSMVKVIWHDSKPSDPMYSEGYQSYSPHWAREFRRSKPPSPSATAGHPTAPCGSGKRTRPIKPSKLNSPTR